MSGPLETARTAWGPDVPDWIEALASECAKSSQNKVAVKIDLSAGLVSAVLHKKYAGDMRRVEETVRGIFMAETLMCPALGVIGLNICQDWRRKARHFSPHNTSRVRMRRACRDCPKNAEDPS